jgi:cytoskeletal protein CcmA (bactofilin family)
MESSKFNNVHTMIGPDAIINGPIRLKQGLIVYGKIYGDVITKGAVRVAKNGLVQGNIEGSSIMVGGTVIGDIKSNSQVTLRKNCVLKGDISYRKLHIEDGAQFEGQCDLVIGNINAENVNV